MMKMMCTKIDSNEVKYKRTLKNGEEIPEIDEDEQSDH